MLHGLDWSEWSYGLDGADDSSGSARHGLNKIGKWWHVLDGYMVSSGQVGWMGWMDLIAWIQVD